MDEMMDAYCFMIMQCWCLLYLSGLCY